MVSDYKPVSGSWMDVLDPRAHGIVDDLLSSLVSSGQVQRENLLGFEFALCVGSYTSFWRAYTPKKYSHVRDLEIRPLYEADEWHQIDNLWRECALEALDVTLGEEEEEK